MNKTKLLLIGLMLSLSVGMAYAAANQTGNGSFLIPSDGNRNLSGDISQYGVAVSSKETDGTVNGNQNETPINTSTIWSAVTGILYGIDLQAGAIATASTDWVACWDTNTVAATTTKGDPATAGLTSTFYPLLASCNRTFTASPCYKRAPFIPRAFLSGLTCVANTLTPYVPLWRDAK